MIVVYSTVAPALTPFWGCYPQRLELLGDYLPRVPKRDRSESPNVYTCIFTIIGNIIHEFVRILTKIAKDTSIISFKVGDK